MRHPERDNVITGHQCAGREVMLQIGVISGQPRVEKARAPTNLVSSIRVLLQLGTAARGAGSRIFLETTTSPQEHARDTVPLDLPGNAPVTNIFHPVQVVLKNAPERSVFPPLPP